MRMKQKTKSIVTALLLGVLCAVTLSAVITVPDWETARADLLIGMQYETTGLDLDAVPGWLAALVMLHQNFPLDGWAWGPAAAGLAGKIQPSAVLVIQNGQTKLVNVKNQDGMTKILDMVPDIVSRFSKGKNDDLNLDDVKVDEAEDDKQD